MSTLQFFRSWLQLLQCLGLYLPLLRPDDSKPSSVLPFNGIRFRKGTRELKLASTSTSNTQLTKHSKYQSGKPSSSNQFEINPSEGRGDASLKSCNLIMSYTVIKTVFWFVLTNAVFFAHTLRFFVEHKIPSGRFDKFVNVMWYIFPVATINVTLVILFLRRSFCIRLFKFMFQLLKKSKVQSKDMWNNVTILLFAIVVSNNMTKQYHNWTFDYQNLDTMILHSTFSMCFITQLTIITTVNYIIGILAGDFRVLSNVLREERKNFHDGLRHGTPLEINCKWNSSKSTNNKPPSETEVICSCDRKKKELGILFKMIEEEILLIDYGMELITGTFSEILLLLICYTVNDVLISSYFLLGGTGDGKYQDGLIGALVEVLSFLFFINHPADFFSESVSKVEM